MSPRGLLARVRLAASTAVTSVFGSSTSKRKLNQLLASGTGEGTCDDAPLPPSIGGDGCWLYNRAVTPAVKNAYRRSVAVFLFFCVALQLSLDGAVAIDLAFCKFCDEQFSEGGGRRSENACCLNL